MANTYTLIASNTLSVDTTNITFSSIPSTYTDLVIKATIAASGAGGFGDTNIYFNSDNASGNYSMTNLRGNGATAASSRQSSTNNTSLFLSMGDNYGSNELYIPNYTSSSNKPFYYFSAAEANATTAYIDVQANLWRGTSAITSITWGSGFKAGSTFYLYGIKNA